MEKDRLTAFSDGVIAIVITIMVLELKAPRGATLADLATLIPEFFSYALSFVYVAIYWNNHHHMLQMVKHVDGLILWANTHLLFWLSLIPFATAWMGENYFAPLPTAIYGLALLLPAIAYYLLQKSIIRSQGHGSLLAKAVGSDFKGKISPFLYVAGIFLSFPHPLMANVIYAFVALIWLVPDRRIERILQKK
jgi:uncharacterized membrane protein